MIIVLFVLMISPGFVNASHGESNDSAYEHDSSESNHLYEAVKTNPEVITTRGVLPEMTTDAEKVEWVDSLIRCSENFPEIDEHLAEYGGPIESFGFAGEGYIEVGLDTESPEKANDSTINEIYQVIKEHYEKEGIKNVPVVFVWQHIVEVGEDTSSLSDEEIGENKTTKQSPGFTSITLILGLTLGLFLAAKTKR